MVTAGADLVSGHANSKATGRCSAGTLQGIDGQPVWGLNPALLVLKEVNCHPKGDVNWKVGLERAPFALQMSRSYSVTGLECLTYVQINVCTQTRIDVGGKSAVELTRMP